MLIFLMAIITSVSMSVFSNERGRVHVHGSCILLNTLGEVRAVFPGIRCYFFDDGRFLSAGQSTLRLFLKDGAISWEYPVGVPNFSVSISPDQKRINIISQKFSMPEKKIFNFGIDILDMEGKILKNLSGFSTRNVFLGPKSITEIPSQIKTSRHSWFRKGNYLLTVPQKGIIVLSRELKVIHSFKLPNSIGQHIESLQVTSSGVLYYLNKAFRLSKEDVMATAIQEFDIDSGKVTFSYPSVPNGSFHIPFGGSVQRIGDDQYQVSHPLAGLYTISRGDSRILNFTAGPLFNDKGIRPASSLVVPKLDSFFKSWDL